MSINTQKIELQSLSSLSMQQGMRDLRESIPLGMNPCKSSFGLVNILKDSDQFANKDFRNSLDLINSNIVYSKNSNPHQKVNLQLNQQDKHRIQQAGQEPIYIGQAHSDYEQQQDSNQPKLEPCLENESHTYRLNEYLPEDLAKVLRQREIPLQYVRGLLLVKDQKQIKSVRRLKVQRYQQKRRNKTWSRKICYNCRQKVAQERLRVKGKFIKKRRAIQILGITIPTSLAQLKKKLQQLLKDKNGSEIQEIIKTQKTQQDIN